MKTRSFAIAGTDAAMTGIRNMLSNHPRLVRSSGSARIALSSFVLAGMVLPLPACSDNEPKYQVPDNDRVVTISAGDLGVEPATFSQCGVHTLFSEPTRGEFPSAICIVRVESFVDLNSKRLLRIVPLPVHHAVYWNHLFDELPAVREVVFLGKPGLDPRGYGYEDILDVARARECGLCMIYARLEETDADAEYAGILWNTHDRKALATVRVPVVLPPEVVEDINEDEDTDSAVAEADFRSEQEFRRLVRDLVWDVAKQDVAETGAEQNPWKEYTPTIPYYDRYRYPGIDQPIPYNSPGKTPKESDGVTPVGEATPTDEPLHETPGDGTRVAGEPLNGDE